MSTSRPSSRTRAQANHVHGRLRPYAQAIPRNPMEPRDRTAGSSLQRQGRSRNCSGDGTIEIEIDTHGCMCAVQESTTARNCSRRPWRVHYRGEQKAESTRARIARHIKRSPLGSTEQPFEPSSISSNSAMPDNGSQSEPSIFCKSFLRSTDSKLRKNAFFKHQVNLSNWRTVS